MSYYNHALDCDRIQLLPVGKDNDIITSPVVQPVVGERGMRLVQILRRDLVFFWESVKVALQVFPGVLILSHEDEFVDAPVISLLLPPFDAAHIGIVNEISPQFAIFIPIDGKQRVSVATMSAVFIESRS